MKFLVIHGPNLDRLGTRQPEIYGTQTLEELDSAIRSLAGELDVEVDCHQSAREGEIVELLNSATGTAGAIVNPAAYSHTSRAIADAISGATFPVVEVHLSNIHAREEWRRTSVTAEAAHGIIAGLGSGGYLAALRWLVTATKGAS